MGRGRGGVISVVKLYVKRHPHPTSPIEGEEKQRRASGAIPAPYVFRMKLLICYRSAK